MNMRKAIILLVAVALSALASVSAGAQTVVCNIVSSTSGEATGVYNIEFNRNGIYATPLFTGDKICGNGGGVVVDNCYRFIRYHEFLGQILPYFYRLYLDDGTLDEDATSIHVNDRSLFATDLAFDSSTGQVYGVFYNDDYTGYVLGIAHDDTFTRTVVGSFPDRMVALACDQDGQLFGIDNAGDLYRIDKTNASLTLVGATGVVPAAKQGSAAFGQDGLYWMACASDGTCHLYLVDTTTGAATDLGHLDGSEDVAGLYITHDTNVNDGAPARVTGLTAAFPDGSHTGTVTFRMPEVSYDRQPLGNDLSYTVHIDDGQDANGDAMPGAWVTAVPVTTSGDGMKTIRVACSNAEGSGLSRDTALWVGYDVPAAPTNVLLTVDGSQLATLSWTAPTTGIHGGYVDTQGLTYRVTDINGQTILSDVAANSCTMQLDIKEREAVQYTVAAMNHGHEGEEAASNTVYVGDNTTLPYAQHFDSDDALASMLVVDANGDGSTWTQNTAQQNVFIMTSRGADDWLATPAFALQGGHTYRFAFSARNNNARRTELVAAAYGTGDEPTAYTTLIDTTTLSSTQMETLQQDVTIPADGTYRFAIHALTERNGNRIIVDDISLEDVTGAYMPDSVAVLTATAADNDALEATLSFTMPTRTVGGDALDGSLSAGISRNGQHVATLDGLTPGQEVSWTDTHAQQGEMTYGVTVTSATASSATATATCYVGTDIPLAPSNVRASFSDGRMHVSWDAPTGVGRHGKTLDPATLRYIIYKVSKSQVVADGIEGTRYDFDEDLSGEQDILYYAVAAKSDGGEGDYAVSNIMLKGDAYTLPFSESFPDGTTTHFWWTANNGTNNFQPETSVSHDGDNGSVYFYAAQPGDEAMLRTGKLSLAGADNPTLSFWYYAYPGHDATLYVDALDADWQATTLDSIAYRQLPAGEGWRKQTVSLAALKGNTDVVLQFRAKASDTSTAVAFDDVAIRDQRQHDLSLSMVAPTAVTPGQQRTATVTVSNTGTEAATAFTVTLYNDDILVADSAIGGVEPDGSVVVPLTFSVPVLATDAFLLRAAIDWQPDELPDNDTASATIRVIPSQLPTVALTGESRDGKTLLAWDEPVVLGFMTNEGFETYDAWSHQPGLWTAIDGDGQPTVSARGITWPGVEEPAAFFVFNTDQCGQDTEGDTYSMFRPHGGRQYMACFGAQSGTDDDWLVSPTLSGNAQTVSFYARSISNAYRENFDVAYSMADTTDVTLFTTYTTVTRAENMWTRYTASLPEGARRFAIHLTTPSANTFALLVDDVSYEGERLAVEGYDLYRDGELLATGDNAMHSYADTDGLRHSYQVVVRYNLGLSAPSEPFTSTTGIGSISTGDDNRQPVYSIDGKRVADSLDKLPAHRHGIYVVKGKKFTF